MALDQEIQVLEEKKQKIEISSNWILENGKKSPKRKEQIQLAMEKMHLDHWTFIKEIKSGDIKSIDLAILELSKTMLELKGVPPPKKYVIYFLF